MDMFRCTYVGAGFKYEKYSRVGCERGESAWGLNSNWIKWSLLEGCLSD